MSKAHAMTIESEKGLKLHPFESHHLTVGQIYGEPPSHTWSMHTSTKDGQFSGPFGMLEEF